jgi:hypothetical protein
MIVTLTWAEMMTAYHIASQRRIMNMRKKLPGRYGAPEQDGSEELDIISTRGEMAVAKGLNLYWSGSVGDYGAVDVGGLVEVRTRTKDWHSLIVHPGDRDWSPYVLVDASQTPDLRLVGWVFGRDWKNERFWADPSKKNRPAYFIEQRELRPISELVALLKQGSITPNDRASEAA